MRFCPTEEVNRARNKLCIFKAKYMVQLKSLKTNGQKQILLKNIQSYIEGNIDEIYEKF